MWEKTPIPYYENAIPAPLTQLLHANAFPSFCGYATLSIQPPPGKPHVHNGMLVFEASEALEKQRGKKSTQKNSRQVNKYINSALNPYPPVKLFSVQETKSGFLLLAEIKSQGFLSNVS